MIGKYLICFLSGVLIHSYANAKEIAITFDDAPRFARGYFDGETRSRELIRQLTEHEVPQVAFFAVSNHLDDEGAERLARYADAGFAIANHTHSHANFRTTSLEQYHSEFLIADEALREFDNFKPWFRFPYLREGDTLEKRDGMRQLMAERGYINAYVTIDNYDWYIEHLFQQAIAADPSLDLERVRAFYVSQMMAAVNHYDQMAIAHLGRSPKHVLLLHEMDISALFIGDLVSALRDDGWTIISAEEAYTDEISTFQIEQVGVSNGGRVVEIAYDGGQRTNLSHESLDETYLETRFNEEVLSAD